MIYTNRSYEHHRCATRRDHLLPVREAHRNRAEPLWKSLACAVLVFAFGVMLVAVWGMFG